MGYIRVHFADESWTTMPCKAKTPAKDICDVSPRARSPATGSRSVCPLQQIAKKRNLNALVDQHALFMVETEPNTDRAFGTLCMSFVLIAVLPRRL